MKFGKEKLNSHLNGLGKGHIVYRFTFPTLWLSSRRAPNFFSKMPLKFSDFFPDFVIRKSQKIGRVT